MTTVLVAFRNLVLADEDGHVRVVQDVVADGAQERAPDLAQPPRARHDTRGALRFRRLHDGVPGLPVEPQQLAADLRSGKGECRVWA